MSSPSHSRQNPRSAPPPSLRKLSREEAKEAIVAMCGLSYKPLLIGVAAVRMGSFWSLEETEKLFQELVSESRIRPITRQEKDRFDLRDGYVIDAGVNSGSGSPR